VPESYSGGHPDKTGTFLQKRQAKVNKRNDYKTVGAFPMRRDIREDSLNNSGFL